MPIIAPPIWLVIKNFQVDMTNYAKALDIRRV